MARVGPIPGMVGLWALFVWVVAMAASYPSLLLHELGHAAVALQQTSGPVLVQVGSRDGARRVSFGRLTVSLSLRGCGGLCWARNDRPLSRAAMLKRVLAGPAVNLVLALLLAAVAIRTRGLVGTACASVALINAVTFVGNLVPRYARGGVTAGRPTDGLKALYLMRGEPVPVATARKPPPVKSKRGSGNRRVTGGTIGTALGILVVGGLVVAGRIPADKALVPLATVAFFAWLADASVRGRRRGTRAPSEPEKTSPPTMKTCPSCGAEVQSGARLCYCYHEFM